MHTRERELDTARAFHGEGGPELPSDVLEATRSEARGLAAAGRTAVRRALSGDSQAFLRAARQQGGE
jgi:hypothetical protein